VPSKARRVGERSESYCKLDSLRSQSLFGSVICCGPHPGPPPQAQGYRI
jgi:hypothetical protein